MASRLTMTHNELVEAIREAQERPENVEGALSTQQIVDATGMGITKVRRILRQLIDEGRAEEVRVQVRKLGGVVGPTTKYRVRAADVVKLRKAG